MLHLEAGVELVDDDRVGVGPSAVRNPCAVVLDLIGADGLGGRSDGGEGVRGSEKTLGQRLLSLWLEGWAWDQESSREVGRLTLNDCILSERVH